MLPLRHRHRHHCRCRPSDWERTDTDDPAASPSRPNAQETSLPDRALISAQGKVLALLAAILDRAGVVDASEFGSMLSTFSDLDGDAEQRAILAAWADAIHEAANTKEPSE